VDYLKFLSYTTLGKRERELSHLFMRKDDFFLEILLES